LDIAGGYRFRSHEELVPYIFKLDVICRRVLLLTLLYSILFHTIAMVLFDADRSLLQMRRGKEKKCQLQADNSD
jgi:hypothetical protein